MFAFKIFSTDKPPILSASLSFNTSLSQNRQIQSRSYSQLVALEPKTRANYGEVTFKYFFTKFFNNFFITTDFKSDLLSFKKNLIENAHNNISKFVTVFEKFDISYKFQYRAFRKKLKKKT